MNQSTREPDKRRTSYGGIPGLNHLAYEVDDVDTLRGRLKSGGYKDSTVPNKHPYRKRVHFFDSEDNDWEYVQYLSDEAVMRNDYELSDQ